MQNFSQYISKIAVIILLIISGFSITFGQESTKLSKTVFLNVTVTDKYNKFVTNLKADDFQVLTGKTPQKIVSVETSDKELLSVLILFDASDSISIKKLNAARYGLVELLNKCSICSEFSFIAFNEKPQLLLDFTEDRKTFFKTIESFAGVKPWGNSAFYDALYVGLEKLSQSKLGKKVIIIIGDGQDNVSKYTFSEVRKLLKESDVLIYSVGMLSDSDYGSSDGIRGQAFLSEVSSISGGSPFYPENETEINEIFRRIAEELGNQYKIGFELSEEFLKVEKKDNRQVLKIKLGVTKDFQKKSGTLFVRTRQGLYLKSKS